MSSWERDEKRKYQGNEKRKEREKENIFLYVFLNVGKKRRKQFFSLLWFSKRMEREITVFLFYTLEYDL